MTMKSQTETVSTPSRPAMALARRPIVTEVPIVRSIEA
jgi:hypothetical protein